MMNRKFFIALTIAFLTFNLYSSSVEIPEKSLTDDYVEIYQYSSVLHHTPIIGKLLFPAVKIKMARAAWEAECLKYEKFIKKHPYQHAINNALWYSPILLMALVTVKY